MHLLLSIHADNKDTVLPICSVGCGQQVESGNLLCVSRAIVVLHII